MNANTKHVLLGFKKLNAQERKEFYEIIKGFEDYPYSTESKIEESIGLECLSESRINKSSVNFGPSPNGCPCCGNG
ncbi:hypothetical protein [Agarivorans sp. QJM3NY_25]|uniref:hypothetical protein n=1 Tax=Agarivorans sp. QJM3NY_25 TaxID=3421430 RepID=UPI003D7F1407